MGESGDSLALLLHQRRELANARRYLITYLRRQAITPPYGCDRCGAMVNDPRRAGLFDNEGPLVPRHGLPTSIDEEIDTRMVAWLCQPCRKIVRAEGGTINCYWAWPGPTPPRRHRGVSRLDPAAHRSAIDDAALVDGASQARVYCESYLARINAPEAWLARILRTPKFCPTESAVFNQAWHAYAAHWWSNRRRSVPPDEPLGTITLLPLRERPQRHTATPPPWDSTKKGPRPSEPYDEAKVLARLEQAEAAFDRRITEILTRGGATTPLRHAATVDEEADTSA